MSTSGREEEEKSFSQKFRSAVLSEKLRQAFHWATNSEGGGFSFRMIYILRQE